MRFDDTLETVLSADMSTEAGRHSRWRQLVDLIGRRRAEATDRAMDTLYALRDEVPAPVRAASAKALDHADPPAPLVRLFALDDLAVALPVLGSARLSVAAWTELLPDLSREARSVLRGRRDLDPAVYRALERFGADFVLTDGRDPATDAQTDSLAGKPGAIAETPGRDSVATNGDTGSSFAPVGAIASGMPIVAQAIRESGDAAPATDGAQSAKDGDGPTADSTGPFRIADVVARIDAFQRERDAYRAAGGDRGEAAPVASFRFASDATGIIRWVDIDERGPLIGLSLDFSASSEMPGSEMSGPELSGPELSGVDGAVAGAFRRRSRFADGRATIAGDSVVAGDWRISGIPVFDPASGRFTGFRGEARRPRRDERAEPAATGRTAQSLRQLVHELRTPAGAISGFAEMIEGQMLGPVAEAYRDQAGVIRGETRNLLGVIDDLDLAARIADDSLDLHPEAIALAPLLARISDDLTPLATMRGAAIVLPADIGIAVSGDVRAVERLLTRLLATLLSAAAPDTRIAVRAERESAAAISLVLDRPAGLPGYPGEREAIDEEACEDSAVLGTGFALRLSRNLARELGGALRFESERLTLRLPAAEDREVAQAN